ncbi:carbonic anhydrase [Natrialbaceae archaeon A-CW2]|uniref:carbonic anhydrase n=1 Tax=Natronosalvus amylolyticus TaxID=2961994 RepID=UPI0020C9FDF1|nr:carbonic anhydrase [Natronosalvus amylolyticus]
MCPPKDSTADDSTDEVSSTLLELLEGNDQHVAGLEDDYFDGLQSKQRPDVVSICCSDSRVSQEGMWALDRPGAVFTPSNIGNQAWDDHEGERIVDGSLLYPVHYAGTEAIAVVGHTGCGAVTAAYQAATGGNLPEPVGVGKWVDMLVPVIEEGLESDLVDTEDETTGDSLEEFEIINQLVEYNVDYQISFVTESDDVPEGVDTFGFVYDFHGVYGDGQGRAYLVNYNGETKPSAIEAMLPDGHAGVTRSLLY